MYFITNENKQSKNSFNLYEKTIRNINSSFASIRNFLYSVNNLWTQITDKRPATIFQFLDTNLIE